MAKKNQNQASEDSKSLKHSDLILMKAARVLEQIEDLDTETAKTVFNVCIDVKESEKSKRGNPKIKIMGAEGMPEELKQHLAEMLGNMGRD